MNLLKLISLPLLSVATVLIDWLFPNEGNEYKHYEGWFGATPRGKSWDEMTKSEKEDSATRMFK